MVFRMVILLLIIGFVQSEEYNGSPFDYNYGITLDSIFVSDTGTVTDINLQISLNGRISQIRVLLISPYGTPVTLWDHGLGGTILYQTVFDDSSSTLITEGSPPYIGSHRPIEELSQLNGESVTGYWQLMVYLDNDNDPGSITSWSLFVETDDSLPDEPFYYGVEYEGNTINYDYGITLDSIFVSDTGTVADINMQISLEGRISQIRVVIISPNDIPITLWDHSLGGTILYQTIFDDSSSTLITEGSPPYIGSHSPIEELSQLNGESVAGYWQLMVYLDNDNDPGLVTSWSLFIVTNESLTVYNSQSILPINISLKQNYPNPFNTSTKIEFNNPYNSLVSLIVYDLTGRKVQTLMNQKLISGKYSIIWDGSNISSGIYFITMTSEGFIQTRKAVLLK